MTSTSLWNYALYLPSDTTPDKYLNISFSGVKEGVSPFSLTQSPLQMAAKVYHLLDCMLLLLLLLLFMLFDQCCLLSYF